MQQINEAKFIERDVTLRDIMFSSEVSETRRAIVRWLALSLGIINPGESRQSAIAVLDSLLYFHFSERSDPTLNDLQSYISKNWEEINEKTLRYHLLQFRKKGLVENSKGKFYMAKPPIGDAYDEEEWARNYIDSLVKPIQEKIIIALKELKVRI
ncbi:MAG: hypothetical protein QW045_02070 [Candidatus Micrarchaeaceae archaeon]